jgi:hypothetical protein
LFFSEDRSIFYIRKNYEVISEYRSQNEILTWEKDRLLCFFKIICSTAVTLKDEPLYSTIGQFQKLFGLREDDNPYNYKLYILYQTILDTDQNWDRLYEKRTHLVEISRGLREYFQLVALASSKLELKQRDFVAICEAGPHAVQIARGLCALRLGQCDTENNVAFLKENAPQAAERAKELALCQLGVTTEQFTRHVSTMKSDYDTKMRIMYAAKVRRTNRSRRLSSLATLSLFLIAGIIVIAVGALAVPAISLPLIILSSSLFFTGAASVLIFFRRSRRFIDTPPPHSSTIEPFHVELKVFEGYQLFPEQFGLSQQMAVDELMLEEADDFPLIVAVENSAVVQQNKTIDVQPATAPIGWQAMFRQWLSYCALPRRSHQPIPYQLTGEYQLLLRDEELAQWEHDEIIEDAINGVRSALAHRQEIMDRIKRIKHPDRDNEASDDQSIFCPLKQQGEELHFFINEKLSYVSFIEDDQPDTERCLEWSDFVNRKVCFAFPTEEEQPNIERRIAEIRQRALMIQDAAYDFISSIEADIEQDITKHSLLFPNHVARRQQRAADIHRLFSCSNSNRKTGAFPSDTTPPKERVIP